ncbi:transcription factor TFIIIB component B'' homolog isoform X2 [Oryzias melastigma]|uniref:transcription factor TFIIIB component B'' homolog isoform X2 n=1 Tax=Oryzias melastigma TaxID=30732 RepID=UPI000CF7C580|nr:transcription factor TFIIIB component B'' homolog isoform X2 [Oryzias melastigma]
MFRRSRFSVRPNVGAVGRTTAASQDSPAPKQDGTPKEASEGSSVPDESNAAPPEKAPASGDTTDQNGDGSSSSAALQRRKRFSIKPKVAPGRPSAPPRTPKSPLKTASGPPGETTPSEIEKPSTSSQAGTSATPNRLQSPRSRRLSENSKQHKPQPKPQPLETPPISVAEGSKEQTPPAADGSKKPESTSRSHLKEGATRLPDKVPPSIPDKAATEISEKARALVSSKTAGSLPPSALYLSRLLNSPVDVQRMMKAQKLRELLRQERCKETRIKRAKARCKEFDLDPTKMTMRDLIHYLPTSNPMTSVLDDSAEENETEVPPSVERQELPERAWEPAAPLPPKLISSEEEGPAGEGEEEQEEELMVPQVKVAEDGSLIIDEESLTVEVQRSKGPNTIQDRDPIFERGSTTTYSSFRKGTHTKPWSIEETDMFYLAISMVGTDFSMICQLFTHRARSEIKNKFKREERANSWRIDKAFRERRKLDIEYFSKLLEKVLEVQKDRKKLKKLSENTSKKCKRKPKSKHSTKKLSDVEEEDEEEGGSPMPELEGEKENEDQSNEGEAAAVKTGRKRKKKNPAEALNEEPSDKKNKSGEAGVPEDSEASLPGDVTTSDMVETTENVKTVKDAAIKPAKLCRGRAPKLLIPLGLKRGKKPLPSAKAKDTEEDQREETEREGAEQEQGRSENEAQECQEKKRKDDGDVYSEGEEDSAVKPQKPTRYGRVPKPIQPLMYAAKDDLDSPKSPDASKGPVKRVKTVKPPPVQKSKKPKLVTLRSSKSEFSDEENEDEWEEEERHLACSSSRDSDAHGFVQSSLHASSTEISEVDDTMVELDILDSMPDVLGISQDALCPDSACQQAHYDTGTSDPCEHQLDLLVDVIDFISSEQTEVSQDESYTEAAQTLLTIGNLAHISQSAQSGDTLEECTAETSLGVSEFTYAEEEMLTASPQKGVTSLESADQKVTEKPLGVDLGSDNSLPSETSDQNVDQLGCKSGEKSSLIKAGPRSKLKPKPNVGRSSRSAKPVSQNEMSTEGGAEKSVSQGLDNETSVPDEETTPGISASAAALFKDNSSSKHACVDQVEAGPNFLITQSQTVVESQSGPPVESEAGLHKPVEAVPEVEQPSSTDQDGTNKPQLSAPNNSTQSHAEDVKSSSQPRGRLSKVKPKPVLQTSRMARSKRQTTEEMAEKQLIETQNSAAKTPADKQTTSEETTSSKALFQEALNVTKVVPELCVEQTNKDSETTVEETVSTGLKEPELPAPNKSHLDSKRKGDSAAVNDTADEATSSRGSCQPRKARLQKVKPKPNLPQVSRGARSKAQNTEDVVQKNAPVEVELQEKLSANEMKTNDGVNDQEVFVKSHTETQNLSFPSSLEQATGNTTSDLAKESAGSRVENLVLTDINLQVPEQGISTNLVESVNSSSLNKSVEELAATEEQKSVPTCQTKRNRLSKTKPNLQTSRTARSKPQTAEEATQKCPLPDERLDVRKEVEQEPNLSVDKDTQKQTGFVDNKALTGQRTKENPSEIQLEPFIEQTFKDAGAATENVSYCVGLESTLEPGESGKPSAAVEKLTSGPEEEPKATSQIKRGRLQKLKPKPNLSRATRSKSSKDLEGKESKSTLDSKVHEDTMPVMEATLPLGSQLETVLTPAIQPLTIDSSSNEEQKTLVRLDSIDTSAEISDQSTTKTQNVSEVQLGTTRVEGSPTAFSDKNLKSGIEPTDSRAPEAPKLDPDPIQEQTSSVVRPPATKHSSEVASSCSPARSRLSKIKPKPNLTITSRAARSRSQISNASAQSSESCKKLEPQNGSFLSSALQSQTASSAEEKHLGHADRTETGQSASKNQNICEVLVEPCEDQESVSEIREETSLVGKSPEVQQLSVEAQSKLQKIQPKPNLPHTSRTTRIGRPTQEKDASETQVDVEQDSMELTSDEKAAGTQNISAVSSEDQTTGKKEEASSSFVGAPEDGLRNATTKEPEDGEVRQELHPTVSANKRVDEEDEAASTPQSKRRRFQTPKPNLPVTSKSAKFQPKEPVQLTQAIDEPQISKSPDSSMTEVEAQPGVTSHKIKSPVSEPSVELSSSHKFVEESSSENQTNVVSSSEQNVPQRRPRLSRVKPKPNLASSSRASLRKVQQDDGSKSTSLPPEQQPQRGLKMETRRNSNRDLKNSSQPAQAGSTSSSNASSVCAEGRSSEQSIGAPLEAAESFRMSNKAPQPPMREQTNTDSDIHSKKADATQKAAFDPCPDSQWPVGGDIDKHSEEASSTQNTSALNPEGIHTYPLLMEMLPEQVPSDPDEPFFILSLTEIPVSSSGDAGTGAAKQLPHLAVADDSTQQSWGSGESFTAAGEKSVSDVPLCVETSEENPAESPEICVARETEAAAAGKKAVSTRSRRTKAEASSSQEEAASEPLKQRGKGKSLKKSDSSLGSKTSNRGGRQTRKAKDVSCDAKTSTSDPPAAKVTAASKSAAPTKRRSASVGSQSRPTSDHKLRSSTPSSTLRSARESCVEINSSEEEPTNVSQYFLSDIFTEVNE